MTKKFFIEYYKPAHQKEALIQFATHVPRSMSVADAKELVRELMQVLVEHKEVAEVPVAAEVPTATE